MGMNPCRPSQLSAKFVHGQFIATIGRGKWPVTVWLDAVSAAEQVPECVSKLEASLARMSSNALQHGLRLLWFPPKGALHTSEPFLRNLVRVVCRNRSSCSHRSGSTW